MDFVVLGTDRLDEYTLLVDSIILVLPSIVNVVIDKFIKSICIPKKFVASVEVIFGNLIFLLVVVI
jgi:hypothetical protein